MDGVLLLQGTQSSIAWKAEWDGWPLLGRRDILMVTVTDFEHRVDEAEPPLLEELGVNFGHIKTKVNFSEETKWLRIGIDRIKSTEKRGPASHGRYRSLWPDNILYLICDVFTSGMISVWSDCALTNHDRVERAISDTCMDSSSLEPFHYIVF